MIISWLGHSCFKIRSKTTRGGEETILITDPFDESVGITPPKTNADIVTISHTHKDHSFVSNLRGDFFTVDSPGEYSLKGVHIEGIASYHDKKKGEERGLNTIFLIENEGIRICHLGDLGHTLTEKQLSAIGTVDILMIPVGGKYTLDAKEAEEVIGQIEPKIILPMHYKTENVNLDIAEIDEFEKEFGVSNLDSLEKLNIKKKDLDEFENKVIKLIINK